jgi:hypothetical protein
MPAAMKGKTLDDVIKEDQIIANCKKMAQEFAKK